MAEQNAIVRSQEGEPLVTGADIYLGHHTARVGNREIAAAGSSEVDVLLAQAQNVAIGSERAKPLTQSERVAREVGRIGLDLKGFRSDRLGKDEGMAKAA